MRSIVHSALLAVTVALPALAATQPADPIRYLPDRKIFLLTTAQSSYAFGLNPDNRVVHIYWGAPVWRAEDIASAPRRRELSSFDPAEMMDNEEYPAWGGARYLEPAVKIVRADGDRDLVLQYVSHRIHEQQLDIELKDVKDDVRVTLHYKVFPAYSLIERWSTITNASRGALTVEAAESGAWYLPHGSGYRLSYLHGRWAAESQLAREDIQPGLKILESRKGTTSHNFNPWFAIDRGASGEEQGPVWFGALAWSGSWRMSVEETPYNQVRVTGGFNPFDFSYPLEAGESLETPGFYGGFTNAGFGAASRILHRYEREDVLPGGAGSRLRPVLYNSWEATTFSVDEPGQTTLAQKAASLGVELFVMDDGWFGARNNDRAGLGDWVVNPKKFPNGLDPMIRSINALGIEFGLWVEPEMVNPDSDLYRAHPDWVMNFTGRPRTELRNQLILNLARNDVKEHVFEVLDKIASEHNIRYFKWDMNRPFAEPGWPEAGALNERKLWVQYTRNVYEIVDRLRAKHPKLEIESCSGGGGRVDLGILSRVEEVWTSDNTEAFDRLRIQEGFSQAYAPKIMSAWVTDVPNMNGRSTSLQYRFLVAMQGALGIGANLNKWTEADFALGTRMVALYKKIRPAIQTGQLYRLASPSVGELTANEYVSGDQREIVLFAFRHSQEYRLELPAIQLRGLDPEAVYRPSPVDRNKLLNVQPEMSGAWLMQNGVNLRLTGDFDSTAVVFERVQ